MGCGSSTKGKYSEDGAAVEAAPAPEAKPADAKPADAAGAKEAPKAAEPAKPAAAEASKPAAEAPKPAAEPKKEEEEEEDDEEEMTPEQEAEFERQMAARTAAEASAGPGGRKTRCAVSAETEERDPNWKAPVYEKTPDQEKRLTSALGQSFMFAALSSDDLPVVIKAFKETPIASGTKIILQGDAVVSDQPALYVFESGKCSVFKEGSEGAIFQYSKPGEYFGELALLYNAPRAATVVADEDSVLWAIDRNTFNYMVKDAARMANERRKSFLQEVPILKGLTPEEKATLADVMNVKLVMKDEVIIKQGEVGKEFYILESGSLEARVDGNKVKDYEPKDYFGELALLRDAPRAASVVATGEVNKVLSLDSASFGRIVGSLEQVMKERASEYGGIEIP